jgi:hypothetical protein
MPQDPPSSPRTWTTKQLTWNCAAAFVAGTALLYGIGFHWIGQWQTGKSVEKQLAVAACVQDFLLQPDRGLVYAELQSTTSAYKRRRLIEDHKWASGREIAELCDQQIRTLDEAYFKVPDEASEDRQPA